MKKNLQYGKEFDNVTSEAKRKIAYEKDWERKKKKKGMSLKDKRRIQKNLKETEYY